MVRTWNRDLPLRVLLCGLAVAVDAATAFSAGGAVPLAEQRAEKLKAHVERFVVRVTPNLSVVEMGPSDLYRAQGKLIACLWVFPNRARFQCLDEGSVQDVVLE